MQFLPNGALLCYHEAMHMKVASIPPRFHGLWIALAGDRETVLGSGKTAEQAARIAGKKGHDELILARVPRPEIPNDETLRAFAQADAYLKSGDRRVYRTVEELMAALR